MYEYYLLKYSKKQAYYNKHFVNYRYNQTLRRYRTIARRFQVRISTDIYEFTIRNTRTFSGKQSPLARYIHTRSCIRPLCKHKRYSRCKFRNSSAEMAPRSAKLIQPESRISHVNIRCNLRHLGGRETSTRGPNAASSQTGKQRGAVVKRAPSRACRVSSVLLYRQHEMHFCNIC